MPRVLFYVQHLVGLGHDARTAAITRKLVQLGAEVTCEPAVSKMSSLISPARDMQRFHL